MINNDNLTKSLIYLSYLSYSLFNLCEIVKCECYFETEEVCDTLFSIIKEGNIEDIQGLKLQ